MPRPRTPLAKAEATGRTIHDPQRYRDRKEPTNAPLGDPSPFLKLKEIDAWNDYKREGQSWLTEGDRALIEILCGLRVKRMIGIYDLKAITLELALLREAGFTPASRTKIHVPDAGDADPADEFFRAESRH